MFIQIFKSIHKAVKYYRLQRAKQSRYLSQAVQLEEFTNPHIVHGTMIFISLAIVFFILWASFTRINEVAHTPGEVIPFGYQQTVQHLEGGLVKSINVREGDLVREHQILIVLDDVSVVQDLERARSKQLLLEMQEERLRAFLEGRIPNFSIFTNADSAMIRDQTHFFEGMLVARKKEATVIYNQIQQKKHSVEVLEVDLQTAHQSHEYTNDIYRRRMNLNKAGYSSDIQILENARLVNELTGKIGRFKSQIAVAIMEIKEFEDRLASLNARYNDESYQQLATVSSEKEQNLKIIRKLEERISRLEVRSPVGGIVKGLSLNTIGSVVQAGQKVMEIVPLAKNLEVEVKILPRDIGHIRIGQKVQIKFSTYDFSRYGSIDGTLNHISATTFSGDKGERYYQGRIILDRNYVGESSENLIMPGMTIMADIITGEKTILEYMLKPIHVALQTAFKER